MVVSIQEFQEAGMPRGKRPHGTRMWDRAIFVPRFTPKVPNFTVSPVRSLPPAVPDRWRAAPTNPAKSATHAALVNRGPRRADRRRPDAAGSLRCEDS